MTWRGSKRHGRWLKSIAVGFFLVLVCSSELWAQDAAEMTTAEILEELTVIIERQAERLTEADKLLTEQRSGLMKLRVELDSLRESYTRLTETINAHRIYSQNLERELQRLRVHRTVLLTTSAISIVAAVVGWLL